MNDNAETGGEPDPSGGAERVRPKVLQSGDPVSCPHACVDNLHTGFCRACRENFILLDG